MDKNICGHRTFLGKLVSVGNLREDTMNSNYLNIFDNLFYDLDRNYDIKEIYEQASDVLEAVITKLGEVANEMLVGTSKKDDFVDTVIILFVRKIMEQLDAINILYSVALLDPAQIILRSLFENTVNLKFILQEDTEKRAAAYYLDRHYQDVDKGCVFFDEKSDVVRAILLQKGKEELDSCREKIKKKTQALDRVIHSKDVFIEVDTVRRSKLHEKKKKGNRKAYIQWYETCSDITSFYGLMKAVGYKKYYDSIYGGLSLEAHALNTIMGMTVDDSGFIWKWIRNPEGARDTFELACTLSIGALHQIYRYIGDGDSEKAEFRDFFSDFQKKRDIVGHNFDMIPNVSSRKEGL